jgi:hypothetical protein
MIEPSPTAIIKCSSSAAAASAILEAFCERYNEICSTGVLHKNWKESCLATALTALAVRIKGADGIRQDVLDIIDELEQFNA